MRFESKHSFFKNINNKTKNRINLTKTLAEKHQISQFYHLRSVNFLLDAQFSKSVTSDTDQFVQAILDSDDVIFFKSFIYKGIDYHVGDIIYPKSPIIRIGDLDNINPLDVYDLA